MKKVILVDGTGLIYRGFYSIPPYLKSPSGILTNAAYGFTLILLSIIETQQPDCIVVAFDKRGPTFRHEQYAEYKGTRVKAPQELYDQIPLVKKIVTACNIEQFEATGFEADDIIATIVHKLSIEIPESEVLIATGDFDVFQLASQQTSILYPTKGFRSANLFTPERIKEKYGIHPNQIPDYKGLAGDSSDNIPGVRGIGDKTAVSLLTEFGTLENIYENINEITGSKRTKLEMGKQSAFESRGLACLRTDVPVAFDLERCHVAKADISIVRALFAELGFNSLLGRIEKAFGIHNLVKESSNIEENNDFDALFGSLNNQQKTSIQDTKKITNQNNAQGALF